MKQTVIFDMDGTLFQTEPVALAAFRHTFEKLIREGLYYGNIPPDSLMLTQLGKTMDEMWKTLLPDCSVEVHRLADGWMFEYERELIFSRYGKLYPGVEETVKELYQRGYSLFIASNGRPDYVEAILNTFEIRPFFTDLYTAGKYKTKTKADLVHLLLKNYPAERGFMVGDRLSDVEAGKKNGLIVIGCVFGYADPRELADADYVISSMKELIPLVTR
ncbi:HAD family hydrolase [Thermicanus aegyptius]|uniref:HAD family hydrolase n=1 Tax=Thermicanus aegyptius TaxID=94009 RepID=UPI000415DCDB|nr:HAD-IA family hydrolase [Thermicanus aegyptius]